MSNSKEGREAGKVSARQQQAKDPRSTRSNISSADLIVRAQVQSAQQSLRTRGVASQNPESAPTYAATAKSTPVGKGSKFYRNKNSRSHPDVTQKQMCRIKQEVIAKRSRPRQRCGEHQRSVLTGFLGRWWC